MISLVQLYNQIKESKQIGFLYHYTDPKNEESILKNGLKFSNPQEEISNDYYISTTRKKQKWNHQIEIILDGNKISNHYKIIPIQASTFLDKPSKEYYHKIHSKIDSLGGSELAEERILSKQPGYLPLEYVIKINR